MNKNKNLLRNFHCLSFQEHSFHVFTDKNIFINKPFGGNESKQYFPGVNKTNMLKVFKVFLKLDLFQFIQKSNFDD